MHLKASNLNIALFFSALYNPDDDNDDDDDNNDDDDENFYSLSTRSFKVIYIKDYLYL